MNTQNFYEKYEVDFSGGMVLCRPLENNPANALQLKMIKNSRIEALLPCSVIWWDASERFAYLLPDKPSVKELRMSLSKDQCVRLLHSLLKMLVRIEENGILLPENVVLDSTFLFYNADTGEINALYLPEEHKEERSMGGEDFARSMELLMKDTGLADIFEWKQCIAYFRNQAVSVKSMYSYFQNEFPKSGRRGAGASDSRKVSAVILKGGAMELRMPVGKGECVVGRENIYALKRFSTLSSVHCKLYAREGSAFVMDMGSTNGTFLNGRKLERFREYPLREKEILALASLQFRLYFEWEI